MLSINTMSGAAYHYELFGENSYPGIFLFAAFLTLYVLDYFIFERVQLYTYELIHEHLGLKLIWGGLVVCGWVCILPLWGMAVHPDPGLSTAWTYFWLIGTSALFLLGWGISRCANLQKYTFKRWPDRKFSESLGLGTWRSVTARSCTVGFGCSPPLQLHGRGIPFSVDRLDFRLLHQSAGLGLGPTLFS